MPPANFKWIGSSKQQVSQSATFVLQNPSYKDFGKYICQAGNILYDDSTGFDRHEVEVIEICKQFFSLLFKIDFVLIFSSFA